MNKRLLLFFIIITNTLFSQEERVATVGKVTNNNKAVDAIHVINKSSKKGTITNNNGGFEIPVKKGDTLLISGLVYKKKTVIVSKKQLEKQFILVPLEKNTFELREVFISNKSIFYVDKTILRAGENVTNKSLGLPNQNKKPKQTIDSLNIGIGLVMSLNIEAIYRRINGDFKKLKKLNRLEKESNYLQKIRTTLGESFFIEELQIPQDSIQPFFNSFDTKKIIDSYKNEHVLQLIEQLLWQSKKYHEK